MLWPLSGSQIGTEVNMGTSKLVISYDDGVTKIIHEHDGDGHWSVHVQAMINFLRGLGYDVPPEEDKV